jgi:hypothetical protein
MEKRLLDDNIEVFYPVVIFDGKMYEAQFAEGTVNADGKIKLEPRDYVRLHFDYHSSYYNGNYFIDVICKDKLEYYLDSVTNDLEIFDDRRKELSEGYEKELQEDIRQYCLKRINEKSIF